MRCRRGGRRTLRRTDPQSMNRSLTSIPGIPMTISDLCINRPVFTWVLVAIPVVLGLVVVQRARGRPVSQRRLPGLHGHDRAAGGERRGDGDDGHQADRGHHQHGLGHRRAPVDHPGRRLDRHRPVPALEERRRGDAGGARQGQHDPRRPARRDPAADHRQVRHRVDARDDDRRLGPARLPRGDRDRAEADQGAARDGARRRVPSTSSAAACGP